MKRKNLWLATAVLTGLLLVACGNEPIGLNQNNPNNPPTQGGTVDDNKNPEDQEESEEELKKLQFNNKSGFYENDFELTIKSSIEGAKIYYTTNGTDPEVNGQEYTEPIKITDRSKEKNVYSSIKKVNPTEDFVPSGLVTKCTIVRAVAKDAEGEVIKKINGTYFVGIDRASEYEGLPIISMFTDADNLFDYEKGIYVMGKTYDEWVKENPNNKWVEGWQKEGNFSQKGREWEREALIEYLPADGSKGFSQNVGIKIMGAASRRDSQKSFRIISRLEYGKKNIKYGIIPGNLRSDGSGEVEQYRSFVLRNGGNDNSFAKVRDPYLQGLVANRSFDTMQSTPCYLFIDGEFWGMYTLAEDYSDYYIQNNYGIDDDDVVIVKRGDVEEGEDEDSTLYKDMYDFIKNNDMSDAANYKKASEMLDIQNFIEYMCFELYIDNQDSIYEGNNWSMWRSRNIDPANVWADGRWRMLAFDSEYSTDIYGDGNRAKNNTMKNKVTGDPSNSQGHRKPGDLLKSLLKNDEFKAAFVNTLCDMRNIDFEETHALARADEIIELYRNGANKTFERFGPQWVTGNIANHYTERTDVLEKYMKTRFRYFLNHIKESFGLENPNTLTISKYDSSKVNVKVNYTKLMLEEYSGRYFKEFPVTITAQGINGAQVKGIKVNGTMVEGSSATVTVDKETVIEFVLK